MPKSGLPALRESEEQMTLFKWAAIGINEKRLPCPVCHGWEAATAEIVKYLKGDI